MPTRVYQTIGIDLVEYADAFADYFENHGYRCRVEYAELEYPYRPTLHLRRRPETLIFEVVDRLDLKRLDQWVRYGKSCQTDTRIAVGVGPRARVSGEASVALARLGVGLFRASAEGVQEIISPHDLAIHVQLPELRHLPARMRKLFGPVYEKFDRAMWREGFEDACQLVESQARAYLKKGLATGRLQFVKSNGLPMALSAATIDRMTLGRLAIAFQAIAVQTHSDSVIGQCLSRINADRVGVVHHKSLPQTEARLRKNVGKHMYTVIAALRELQ